jgi:DNA-binding transcriptional MerR regulator
MHQATVTGLVPFREKRITMKNYSRMPRHELRKIIGKCLKLGMSLSDIKATVLYRIKRDLSPERFKYGW